MIMWYEKKASIITGKHRVGPHLHWGEFLTKRLQTGETVLLVTQRSWWIHKLHQTAYGSPALSSGFLSVPDLHPTSCQLTQNNPCFVFCYESWVYSILLKIGGWCRWWRQGCGVTLSSLTSIVLSSLSNLSPYFSSPPLSMLPHETPNSSLIL